MNEVWTTEQEAERLRSRFTGVNKAAFARDYKVPGGASMLSQHLSGHRPMSLAAATAYATGFGVPISEISPRLAFEVAAASTTQQVPGTSVANTDLGPLLRGKVPFSAAPAMPSPMPVHGGPALEQALEVVAQALSQVPAEKRQSLLTVLATYSSQPAQEANALAYLSSELAKTQPRTGLLPSDIATGKPPGGGA